MKTIKINPSLTWTTAIATAIIESSCLDVWVEFSDEVEQDDSVQQVIDAAQDAGEDPAQWLEMSDFLDMFVEAIKADLRRNSGMQKTRQAREIIDRTAQIMRGIAIVKKNEKMVNVMLDHATTCEVGKFKILKCVDETKPSKWMEGQLQDRGVDGFVFSREGKQRHSHSLGIVVFKNTLDLTPLVEHLPGWVVDNHMVLWGTYETPKLCLPPEGQPQNTNDLIALLQRVFGSTGQQCPHVFKDYEEYDEDESLA